MKQPYSFDDLPPGKVHGTKTEERATAVWGPDDPRMAGAASKSGGHHGRIESSVSNTLRGAQLGKRGSKDA